jgi:membrane protein DedA with SNARE-associated domain
MIQMGFDQGELLAWFSAYAYQPFWVYGAIIVLMTASSFGLPVPEEVTLVSVGMLAFLASRPDRFPPPFEGAEPVSLHALLWVTFLAVFLSDFLVFFIGRVWGQRIRKSPRFHRYVNSEALLKIEKYMAKYGALMSGVFRFTPGLRFPGHLMCGALGVSVWKFCLVDGLAALVSVPTQVWLVATYGEYILDHFKQFKVVLFAALLGFIGFQLFARYKKISAQKKSLKK